MKISFLEVSKSNLNFWNNRAKQITTCRTVLSEQIFEKHTLR